ncbi:MAG: NFACT family protein [Clostridia bacterium]|nr:NFACT family protein [Clostridia bacterium]
MPLDASAVRCTAYEINSVLKTGRIEKIYQPERDEIVLAIKTPHGNKRLVISANGANPRLYITDTVKENPQEPPMFCMLMRKHLSSGRIVEVKSVDFERITDIAIEGRNELGDVVTKHLMCEIMGKNSNIILVGENGKIVDSIKHVDLSLSRVRNVFPGLAYALPPGGERKNPLEMDKEDFFEVLKDTGEGKTIDKALTGALEGISPLMAREAAHRAIKRCDAIIGEMNEDEKRAVADELYKMFEKIRNYDFEVNILYKKGEAKPFDFAVYPVAQYGEDYICEKMDGICQALEVFYSKRDAQERMRSRSYSLMKTVTGQLEKIRKKISLLHLTLSECEKKEESRIAGDVITANLYRMKKGDTSLTAVNYYDEEQKEITIALDETKTPPQNAQQYYKKYRKAKVAEVEAAKQIEKAKAEAEYLESVIVHIDMAKTPSALDEIKDELIEAGVIKSTFVKKKGIKKVKMSPPEEYLYMGYTIFSGRNNVQNDYLTLKVGRANDMWLHTKNIPGSHVIIKSQGEKIPDKVIEAAAIIASVNSKGASPGKVEVDYCPVSHVKKPNGAKAGMVIYEGYSTAVVSPDESFVESIRKK